MLHRIRFAAPALLLAVAACTSSTNALGPDEEEVDETSPAPEVRLVETSALPLWDSEQYKSSCQTETRACPVVTWRDVEYLALSYRDNRSAFAIHAYDATGALLGVTEAFGARYLAAIRVDTVNAAVTFVGQADLAVTLGWSELEAIR